MTRSEWAAVIYELNLARMCCNMCFYLSTMTWDESPCHFQNKYSEKPRILDYLLNHHISILCVRC